jgi:hypothetical protein
MKMIANQFMMARCILLDLRLMISEDIEIEVSTHRRPSTA